MVPMRVLLLFAIPLIGIFLQKSSSKSIDESNHHLESSSDLDMTNSERAVADSELSNEDETHDIRKRWGRRRRKGGRRRSRRRRRVSVGRVMEGVGEGLGIMQSVKNLFGG
ncbi:uncharacterized protein LOC130046367 isoform X2 [Ostrea edulis]|uniref:uncharacterized protein LOC130046367 isoform X2 n=1 Tax=Ostrea edulis TaxID=37623 RepID=UPI0024AED656|nr:uncharacterized protein LOC130046367 isoform X2 [Ostrea edulis]